MPGLVPGIRVFVSWMAGSSPAMTIFRDGSVGRDLDRVLVGIVDIDRLDRADRTGARPLHADRHAAALDMGDDLVDRRVGDEADMRRHALLTAHGGRAGQI